MIGQFVAVFLFTACYAVMRYAGFGGVSLVHLPAYLMNKSIAMAAMVSLFLTALAFVRGERDRSRFWSRASSHLAGMHVLISLGTLSGGYFPRFFDGDRMNLTGEATLLTGALAVYCLWRLAPDGIEQAFRRKLNALFCTLAGGHLLVMGYGGWLQVQKWHGGLPPITLLCFCLCLASALLFLTGKEPSGA